MRTICWIILFTCISMVTMGQRKNAAKPIQAPTPLKSTKLKSSSKSDWSVGVSTSTNSGIIGGVQFRKPWGTKEIKNFVELEAVALQDYREFDSPSTYNGRTHIEGKLNQLFVIRPSLGRQWTLLQKSSDGGQKLIGLISSGPSIGLQKPYYVDISYNNGIQSTAQVPLAKTLDNTYKRVFIIGESSAFKGLNESNIIPGWNLKTAVKMEIETLKQNNIGVEIGFVVDYFTKPIEMLNLTAGRQVYTTAYISFSFGKHTN
jgi:hypothetical protein